MESELKPLWRKIFHFDWKFGLFLLLIICVPRFILVLNANQSGNYNAIGLIMLISAIIPFVFLSQYGRTQIGISRPKKYSWLLLAFLLGFIFSLLLYYVAESLYGSDYTNWYKYIGKSYKLPPHLNPSDKTIFFVIFALVGMTFSPIGEELFFRGIVHTAFAKSIGEKNASLVDSSAFALTHISHFGLVFINQQWSFLPVPTIIWVFSMFLVSNMFFFFKKRSESILGAMICHSAFNLGMTYCIFYLL